jgi:lysophospholipase L1-like esterase
VRRARPYFVAAAVFVLLLAGAEGLARVASPEPSPAWVPHPFLGRVRPASWSCERVSIEDGSTFTFRTNAIGMRGSSIAGPAKPKGTYRIFFAGASTTENPNLPEEKTFPAIVERLLNEELKGSPRVEVGNVGISGNASAGTLAQVSQRLLALDPDAILCLEGNDVFESMGDEWEPTTYHLARDRPPKFRQWFLSVSRLASLLDEKLSPGSEQDPRPLYRRRAAQRRQASVNEPGDDVLLRGRDVFRSNLRRMSLLCEDAHVRFGLMTVAWLYKDVQPPDEDAVIWQIQAGRYNLSTRTARRAVDVYNGLVRAVASERGALLVDLDAAVPRDLAHLVDDVHLTVLGNQVAARAITAAILADGAIRAPRHAGQ